MNGWQPIETAPRDGVDVLLHRPNVYGVPMPIVAAWAQEEWRSYDQPLKRVDGQPTHWMPLPAAPDAA